MTNFDENQGVRLTKINWDNECTMDLMRGRGFIVSQPAITGKDTKSMYGIQSPMFASDWTDGDDAFTDRYACKCGAMKGKIFEGEICPECNTRIEYRDVDLSYTGWIVLKDHKIIQPIYYKKLASIIGAKVFDEIIEYNKSIDRDGHVSEKTTAQNPFKGIGLIEFQERFQEILEYFKTKKKKKLDEIKEIEDEKDNVFTSSIPVYSAVLRPLSFRNDSFFYTTIDKKYNSIYTSVHLLNDTSLYDKRRKKWTKEKRERMGIPTILSKVQYTLMEVWDLIFELINHKDGHIKGEILGGMINWSSRCRLNAT